MAIKSVNKQIAIYEALPGTEKERATDTWNYLDEFFPHICVRLYKAKGVCCMTQFL